jgi:hypothetical protein
MKLDGLHQPPPRAQAARLLFRSRYQLAWLPVSEDSDDLGEELLLAPPRHSLTGLTMSDIGKPSGSSNIRNRVTNISRSRRMT